MPILTIEAVGTLSDPETSATRCANMAGAVFGLSAGRCWVKLSVIAKTYYAENDIEEGAPMPVFVGVLLAKPPAGEARRMQAEDLACAIALALHRPKENIHIIYEPDAKGRVAFGGKLLM